MTAPNQIPPLKAEPRKTGGKSEVRRVRRNGLVPAVAYGPGFPSTPIAVPPKEVASVLRSELGRNTVIELNLEGTKHLAMIRDFTLHPVERYLEHVDFIEVKLDRPVDVEVPLFATGKPIGVTKGGVLRIVYRLVPIRCLPDRIPLKLEADVTNLELGGHIASQDLKLPEGVTVRTPPTQTLISIVAPEKETEETAAPAPGAPGAPAAAAGAAAPAADAKKDEKKEEKKK